MKITTDASIFEIEPKKVIYPKNSADLVSIIRSLLKEKQEFTMRAGGTSIGGQAIGKGVLVDISKYLTNIIYFEKNNLLPTIRSIQKKIWIHVHCHQKIMSDIKIIKKSLMLIPNIDLEFFGSGCCGMAGDFGYLKNKTSKIIAKQSLGKHIDKIKENDIVIATGSSCRKQFIDIFSTKSIHIAELFYMAT